ncbi:unnamed protein product [Auanema sp. JU1783]|nr:unnamed protein product [Auanema sp. JU1783]
MNIYNLLIPFIPIISLISCSSIETSIGDSAISQVLRHSFDKFLAEPRIFQVLLKTKDDPELNQLATLDVLNRVKYRNLSMNFKEEKIHLIVDDLYVRTETEISDILWPLGLGENTLDVHLQIDRSELLIHVDEKNIELNECNMKNAYMKAHVHDHWIADKGISLLSSLFSPILDRTLCSIIAGEVAGITYNDIRRFPVYDLIPEKTRKYLATDNTTLFYRLKNIRIEDHQMKVLLQLEWTDIMENKVEDLLDSNLSYNTTFLDMEINEEDRVTVWLEDSLINSLISQVDWNFEWMNEQIPVSSPVIPPDSREFLSTLCSQCFFQVNVAARGQPTVSATNDSLVLEKRDRVHLQVVNPQRNVTSVFVSFILTIVAEIRPSFDEGTLRTLVQLLDTNIQMEAGAFPKNWGLFMQDLMRGMIMDMLWPEIKNAIEELSYGKGVRISKACGVDPNQIKLDIGEGNVGLSSRISFTQLDIDKCIRDLKASLPNTSKLFKKNETKR